jgi:hypothetical protein
VRPFSKNKNNLGAKGSKIWSSRSAQEKLIKTLPQKQNENKKDWGIA